PPEPGRGAREQPAVAVLAEAVDARSGRECDVAEPALFAAREPALLERDPQRAVPRLLQRLHAAAAQLGRRRWTEHLHARAVVAAQTAQRAEPDVPVGGLHDRVRRVLRQQVGGLEALLREAWPAARQLQQPVLRGDRRRREAQAGDPRRKPEILTG